MSEHAAPIRRVIQSLAGVVMEGKQHYFVVEANAALDELLAENRRPEIAVAMSFREDYVTALQSEHQRYREALETLAGFDYLPAASIAQGALGAVREPVPPPAGEQPGVWHRAHPVESGEPE